jgi:putative oxidoreductase
MTGPVALRLIRSLSGAVFVVFGIGKFVNHGSELASFRAYGLPAPEVFVVVIGLLELVGGLALIAGWWVRPWALLLAGDMVGAIVVSGVALGEPISLTLAPAQLVAMLVLLRGSSAGRQAGTHALAQPGHDEGERSPEHEPRGDDVREHVVR